jgi:hypothetical protein
VTDTKSSIASTKQRRRDRSLDASVATMQPPDIVHYLHSTFAQICLPYRDPGAEQIWDRRNGAVGLQISAGAIWDPSAGVFRPVGLPYGAKPRLLLAYLNGEAIRTRCPIIDVGDSLTRFTRDLQLPTDGRTVRTVKDQLVRLSSATIRLGVLDQGRALTVNTGIVTQIDLWWTPDDRQKMLWPSEVTLGADYFRSLVDHAVPLHNRALAALSASVMGLDIYAWLAQRLHRIDPGRPQFVTWAAIKDQFGMAYDRMDNFKAEFRRVLVQVQAQYRAARLTHDGRGLTLYHSAPPVIGRTAIVKGISTLARAAPASV